MVSINGGWTGVYKSGMTKRLYIGVKQLTRLPLGYRLTFRLHILTLGLRQLHTRKHFTWNIKQKTMHTWNKYEETRKIYHVHLDLLGVKFSTWSGGRGRGDDWRRYLATGKMQQCNADDFGLSQPAVSRVSQTLEALTSPHLIRRFIKFQPIPGIFKDRRRDSMPLQASLV